MPSAFLCDHPTAPGRTCSDPVCKDHALAFEEGKKHLCPDHRPVRPLQVWTGRVKVYQAPDGLPVTRYLVNDRLGVLFAPSKGLLDRALSARKAGALDEFWPTFEEEYTREMRQLYKAKRPAWEDLLARPQVTLLCFCKPHERCHRLILATILANLGAELYGERPTPQESLF
jgi:uncharacterized protein YeaO (DUF488 family)